MNISRNSWHYKLMWYMDVYPAAADTLCQYIRKFFLAWLKLLVYGAFALVFISFLIAVVICMFGLMIGLWLGWDILPFVPIGWIGWIIVELALCIVLSRRISDRLRDEYRVPRELGPFGQYIKDRHSKICRMISFTE